MGSSWTVNNSSLETVGIPFNFLRQVVRAKNNNRTKWRHMTCRFWGIMKSERWLLLIGLAASFDWSKTCSIWHDLWGPTVQRFRIYTRWKSWRLVVWKYPCLVECYIIVYSVTSRFLSRWYLRPVSYHNMDVSFFPQDRRRLGTAPAELLPEIL